MRHSGEPKRQCIGCRDVRPKKELIRLVLLPSGQTSFDVTHTRQGRGIYLCPQGLCFHRAFKNKKWRKYFPDNECLAALFTEINKTLCATIERFLFVAGKMHCLRDINEGIDTLRRDDVIVLSRECFPDQTRELRTAALKKGTAVIDVPGDCIKEAASLVVKDDFPMVRRLKRDLRMYERLSSKGLVI